MAHHQAPKADNTGDVNCDADGCADAIAATVIIAVVVSTVVFWLSGMA